MPTILENYLIHEKYSYYVIKYLKFNRTYKTFEISLLNLDDSILIIQKNNFYVIYQKCLQAVWVYSLIDYEPPTYHNGEYKYPWWAEAIGWGIASLSIVCIPAFAICVLVRAEGITLSEVYFFLKGDFYPCIY